MAFVPNKSINDNSIISHEIMHYLHKKKNVIKLSWLSIDLANTFHRVEWKFLIYILQQLAFTEKFIH